MQQIAVGFCDRQPWAKARQDSVVTLDAFGKFVDIEKVPLPDRDAIAKGLEPFGRTCNCGHRMTLFDRLLNDLQSRPAGCAQNNQMHPTHSSSGGVPSRLRWCESRTARTALDRGVN